MPGVEVKPYHCIEPIHYVDAETGAIRETVQMRRFYEWDAKRCKYVMVREYALDRESVVNPRFRDGA